MLTDAGIKKDGIEDVEITGITQVIERVRKGNIFVAVCGNNVDGNCFADEALKKGAVAVISDKNECSPFVIRVKDASESLGRLVSAFYCHPERKLILTGVTGTNGKTTVSHYLRHLIENCSERCAVIGTLGSIYDGSDVSFPYTTPLCEDFFYELDKIRKKGIGYCVCEVSSQALVQKRIFPARFSLGILTNIGHDHLDYHKNRENYINAKKTLFGFCKNALINMDTPDYEKFLGISDNTRLFSAKSPFADYCVNDVIINKAAVICSFCADGKSTTVETEGFGEITLYNVMMALSGAHMLGFPSEKLIPALKTLPSVKGRLQRLSDGKRDVYVDFAHTPQALEAVLKELHRMKKGRLICVFGCGGNRDAEKRGIMGKISSEYCDFTVVTDDNPRNEVPYAIAQDIINGINNINSTIYIGDREAAIKYALDLCYKGDIVLVAGKGHEQYQLTGNKKIYFSDEEIIKKYLN